MDLRDSSNSGNNPLQKGFGSKLGFPLSGQSDATPIIAFTSDLPSTGGINNWTTWGMNQGTVALGGQFNWTTHVSQQLNWVRGRHEFKMGWDIRRLRTSGNDLAGTNGSYYFNRAQTADPTRLTSTGSAFASLLLGAVDTGSATAPPAGAVRLPCWILPGHVAAHAAPYYRSRCAL